MTIEEGLQAFLDDMGAKIPSLTEKEVMCLKLGFGRGVNHYLEQEVRGLEVVVQLEGAK